MGSGTASLAGDLFGGISSQNVLTALPALFTTASSFGGMATPAMAAVPAIPGAAAGAVRGLARFPQLYNAILALRQRGVSITVDKLYGLLRRFGPQFLLTAGILSAGALADLILSRSTKHHRRMNPLNPKALSRSVRRLTSFERRAAKVSAALGRISHKRRGRSISRGRCMTCRKSPCSC